MPLKCFISYASHDRVLAQWVANELQSRRYEIWIDRENIRSGELWESSIKQAVAESHATIVVITPQSIKSDWVKREVSMSRELNHPVFPLIMYDINVPEALTALGIGDLQGIHCFLEGINKSIRTLSEALQSLQKSLPATRTRALVIEDTLAHQKSISQVLDNLGINVTLATTNEEALRAIQDTALVFDLITLDMQLEQMDMRGQHGRNLLFEIRMHRGFVPVIIISALEFTVNEIRTFILEENADILSKPFNPRELHKRVVDALKME